MDHRTDSERERGDETLAVETWERPELRFSWIEPGRLAASDMPFFASDIHMLHAQGIRAILTLTEEPLTILPEVTPALLRSLDIRAFHVPLPDGYPPTDAQVPDILNALRGARREGRPLLVHCMLGVGRTGTILHLHYMSQGLTLDAADARIRARRPICTRLTPAQRAFLATWTGS